MCLIDSPGFLSNRSVPQRGSASLPVQMKKEEFFTFFYVSISH